VQKIPEDCPVRDILRQIDKVLEILHTILSHCEECLKKQEEKRM